LHKKQTEVTVAVLKKVHQPIETIGGQLSNRMSKRISRVEAQEQSSGHTTLLEARPQGILANYLTHGKVKNFLGDVTKQISNTDYQGNLRPQNLTNIPELIDPNKAFKIFKELDPFDIERLTLF
jgi:hypothetical protein